MKLVFVLEFEVVPGPDVEMLTQQVGAGLAGMRQAQLGLEPVTSTRRETHVAIRESADMILAVLRPGVSVREPQTDEERRAALDAYRDANQTTQPSTFERPGGH